MTTVVLRRLPLSRFNHIRRWQRHAARVVPGLTRDVELRQRQRQGRRRRRRPRGVVSVLLRRGGVERLEQFLGAREDALAARGEEAGLPVGGGNGAVVAGLRFRDGGEGAVPPIRHSLITAGRGRKGGTSWPYDGPLQYLQFTMHAWTIYFHPF